MLEVIVANRVRFFLRAFILLLFTLAGNINIAQAAATFTAFESGQVRPLAQSPDKRYLFAVNTPDNRLEIFRLREGIPEHVNSVSVGLEPVAVAARSNNEVWVVNHLSDSISVVKFNDPRKAIVTRTLLVGDEPRDVVFAGRGRSRAFITAAHRGQNLPGDPELTTAGVGRADVWVFDTKQLGREPGGKPLEILTLFSDTPRALAVTPDGSRVYAAAFNSGNQTTTAFFPSILPQPTTNFEGIPQQPQGAIVRYDGAHWRDEDGNIHDEFVNFHLPDKDVFVIDANANPPRQLDGDAGFYAGVGTVLFNMVVNPVNNKVYVSNLEARNQLRFEGEGNFAGSSIRGNFQENRITVLDGSAVIPRHLNKHIDYTVCCAPVPNLENEKSLAFPLDMAISSDGQWLYVAALGSSKVGIYNTVALEDDSFVPNTEDHITVSGGGPTGLLLNEEHNKLYVLTRFDNSISVVDTSLREEVTHISMHNPEPDSIVDGRRFLYDAAYTSSHGDSACASCHIFGDFDGLAWDLGNPDDTLLNNPGPFVSPPVTETSFHPMKGPLVTQSLRGMNNHGAMHWRGDRTGGNDEPSAQPDSGAFDERAAFMKFLPAFENLLGRDGPILESEMEAFGEFILQVAYPPNPIRALDNSLTEAQQRGRDAFFDPTIVFNGDKCDTCHVLDLDANPNALWPGFFGADGRNSKDGAAIELKTPHLRNMYQKVGMFGISQQAAPLFPTTTFEFMGDQIRGFGYLKDGSIDTLERFVSFIPFVFPPSSTDPEDTGNIQARKDIEQYMLAFDTNLAPIVGQQITWKKGVDRKTLQKRLNLMKVRSDVGECELIAKTKLNKTEYGFMYLGGDQFQLDRVLKPRVELLLKKAFSTEVFQKVWRWFLSRGYEAPIVSIQELIGKTSPYNEPMTFTCVPSGSGERLGVDRDADGYLDGDEINAGGDPANPYDNP